MNEKIPKSFEIRESKQKKIIAATIVSFRRLFLGDQSLDQVSTFEPFLRKIFSEGTTKCEAGAPHPARLIMPNHSRPKLDWQKGFGRMLVIIYEIRIP